MKTNEELCNVLKALVGEWGPEHIKISFPEDWEKYKIEGKMNFNNIKTEFTTRHTVSIEVFYNGGEIYYGAEVRV